jgi:hypothetical protein
MRILTFLMLAIVVGTGHAWAATDGPSNIKKGTVSNGSIEFYADEACTMSFDTDVAVGATVYVKATAAPGYTAIGVTFTATKGIGSNLIQAPRRIGIASDIAVSAVTGKPDIYSFTMPEDGNFTVTINATFATPAQQLVSYVDENYETHEVDAYVLDETMSVLPAGFYVVPNDLTVDHNIESNSGKGSSVTIIIADGKTLTVNGSFGMPCDLSFFGQGNATGKLTINTTTDIGTSLGGRLTVAHVDITSDGGSLGGFNGCIFAGHQTKGNTVTVRSNGDAIGGGSNDVTIKYCNVDLVSETGSCIITGSSGSSGLTVTGLADGSNMLKLCSKSIAISGGNKVTIKYCDVDIINERNSTISCPYDVTIEGVATGNKVNTVIVRSDGSGINTSNPITISYCNVEMTGTTQTDNVYDACGSSGITTSGGVVITGRTDANNTLKIRCGGKTSPNSYGIAGGQKAVSISRYNVNIVNENFYGIYTSDDVTITGGQVEITGGTKGAGIHSGNGNITLSKTSATDYFKVSSYYVSGIKAVKFADGQRFVAYNMADATDISATAIVSGSVTDLTTINGKTLKPLDGNYVSVNAADFTFSGSTSTTSPFTITTGEGETATTTHYYIYKKDNTVTLTYTGSGIVQVTGLPEGYAAVENQPMQRTFTMPATDVELTATAVTDLTATSVTYDGTARTPEIKQGDDVFDAANYTIAYKLGNDDVTADDVKDANTYTCTLTGVGQYVGTTTVSLTIDKANYHEPEDIQNITKYVPSDKSGSYTIALPSLPEGAAYSFTKTDEGGIIASHAYDAEHNTLTVATNSGTTGGTTATITVEAAGAPNYNDYSFTVIVIVSEYTTAYAWPEQTNIWLDADNELVWAEGGNTLDTSLLTVKKNGAAVTNYTAKVGETVLTAGENLLTLAPGAYRIAITGDDGKLDDWVDFKVIKLIEDADVFNVKVEDCTWRLEGGSGGNAADTPPTNHATLLCNGQELEYSTNNNLNEFLSAHPGLELWFEDNDHMPGNAYVSRVFTINGLSDGDFYNMPLPRPKNRPFNYLGTTVATGSDNQLVFLPHGMSFKLLTDDDGEAVPASSKGGNIFYLCVDAPALHYVETEGANGTEWALYNGDELVPKNYYFRDSNGNVYYGNGSAYTHYNANSSDGNFISFSPISYVVHGGPFNWDPANITVDPENDYTFSYYIYDDWREVQLPNDNFNMVGKDFVILNNAFFYTGDIVPEVVDGYKIKIGDVIRSTIDYPSAYDYYTPIVWLRNATIADLVGEERNCPHAYAKNKVDDYHYQVASCSFIIYPNNSLVEILDLASESKVGEDVTCNVVLHGPKTGVANVFVNGEWYTRLEGTKSHELTFTGLHEGTYEINVFGDGDDYVTSYSTSTSFTVVRTDPVLTLTGKQNTAGEAFEAGANIEYDPENPVIVNAVNDKAVSGTNWKWTISNTDVVTQNHIVNESQQNAVNSEDIYLNTIGLGEVMLTARFSGDYKYNRATEAISFTVVPKQVTSPIIELVDQSTIYYDGTAKEPAVKVYYAEGKEIPADQYDVTYDNNTNVSSTNSKAKIIVKSKTGALYTIDAEKEFEIQETIVLFAANSTNLWATFCSQNEYEVPEGCTAYTIGSISGSTVMLSDALTSIPAYTPVLIQRDANVTLPVTAIYKAAGSAPASGYDAQTGLAWTPGTGFTFYGNCLRSDVSADDFKGYYNEGQTYLLFDGKFILADENGGLGAHKCLLVLNGTNNAPVLSIGTETTSLSPVPSPSREGSSQRWYTLDGRKLNSKPTQKGIYVNGGRKVVIK